MFWNLKKSIGVKILMFHVSLTSSASFLQLDLLIGCHLCLLSVQVLWQQQFIRLGQERLDSLQRRKRQKGT